MSIKKLALVFSLSFLIAGQTRAQEVNVRGNAPSYAGDQLVFYAYSDFITNTEIEVGRCEVNNNGQFNCQLKILDITMVFSYLGVYKIYFFAERGHQYEIVLPKKEAKTRAQSLNPFFQEHEMQVGIKNIDHNDLNYLTSTFDLHFNQNLNKIVQDTYLGKKTMNVDSLLNHIETKFAGSKNQFFNDYRHYRYGLLRQITGLQKSRSLSDEYFLNKPIRYNNPAYMELFNSLYDKYFVFYSHRDEGRSIQHDISVDQSLRKLKKTLGKNSVLANDTLKEMVILKGLYDEFYNDVFSRTALLAILDQLYRKAVNQEHVLIAQNIRSKITRLLPGFVPMPLALNDTSGKEIKLDDFKGKYVYLNFCATDSYTCLQEFPLLQNLYKKYGKYLEIITVLTDDEPRNLAPFLKHTGYNWTFLHFGNNPNVVKEYDVRAFPTYYLIGPDKKLVMAPAPSPRENFELKFRKILQSNN